MSLNGLRYNFQPPAMRTLLISPYNSPVYLVVHHSADYKGDMCQYPVIPLRNRTCVLVWRMPPVTVSNLQLQALLVKAAQCSLLHWCFYPPIPPIPSNAISRHLGARCTRCRILPEAQRLAGCSKWQRDGRKGTSTIRIEARSSGGNHGNPTHRSPEPTLPNLQRLYSRTDESIHVGEGTVRRRTVSGPGTRHQAVQFGQPLFPWTVRGLRGGG